MVSPLSPDSHVCEYQSTGVQHPSTLEFGQIIRQSDQTNYQTCSMRLNSRPIYSKLIVLSNPHVITIAWLCIVK